MRFDVLSLFPSMIQGYLEQSVLGIALEKQLYELNVHNPRDYSLDKHKKVDDTPYGGGAGMLLMPQPFLDCLDAVEKKTEPEIIITSPTGETWKQELAQELSSKSQVIILCGRYEGFDERIKKRATREVSIGDYVLTGGELAALVMMDSILRYVPGVLGAEQSALSDSFSKIDYLAECQRYGVSKKELQNLLDEFGLEKKDLKSMSLLEHPHYTRPADYKGDLVPQELQSGDHKKIFLWRLKESLRKTKSYKNFICYSRK